MTEAKQDPVYFLLVDDLEENLLSLDALLRREGLVLLKAKSGREALELLMIHDVALALLDVQMPVMNGFELAELMRGTDRTRHVPIIFLTAGSADSQRRFRGYEAGAVDFLSKPIESDILRSKSEVFFQLYRQQQLLARQRDELRASAEENARLLQESRQYAAALKEADQRKDEFLATLAHELRNPLAPIKNGLQILRMSTDADILGQVRDMMDRQLTHLVRLIDDLLDVSRVSQGKIDLRKERIALQSVVQAAVEASRPLIDAGQHHLTLEIPEQTLWVEGDLTRLAQTFSNLLNNAAKYTPEGGKITLAVQKNYNDVAVTVSDNGLGIQPDMLQKIFDLFTQIDRDSGRSQGGLGIGLALVKRLIEMHGGTITAKSSGAGKGSAFTVKLPFPAEYFQEEAASPAPLIKAAIRKPLSVLVVDDNLESAKTTGWMLELIGHEAVLSHDGLNALEMAQKMLPDVILLDIGLPGMSGYDVCRELRKDARFKETLMIAQTGWGQARDRQQAKDAGFDHHLLKPIDMDELSKLLEKKKNETS